jgi:hypothetical protein
LPQAITNGTTTLWPFRKVEPGPGLDDLAHELVAQDVALHHRGDEAVIEVQVRTADGGRGDLDDRIAGIDDLGVGHGVHADVVFAVPGQGAHGRLRKTIK